MADKVLTARQGYNLRVVETLVAARALANFLCIRIDEKEKITMREVVERYSEGNGEELERVLLSLLESDTLDILKQENHEFDHFGVTMDEMVKLSGMSKELFNEVYLSWVDGE